MRVLFILSLATFLWSCNGGSSESSLGPVDLPAGAIVQEYADGSGLSKVTVKSGETTISEGDYLEGRKHGQWVEYKGDGLIMSITNYRNGLKHGVALTFSDRAEVATKASYYTDVLEGEFIEYNRRKIKSISNYSGGKLNGSKKSFYENGKIQEDSNYKDGILDGVAKYYNNQGDLLFEYVYEDGKIKEE